MPQKWETPLYPYKLPRREVLVNVTRSCPRFENPTPGIPDHAAALRKTGRMRVLDFGAGKLRNALFLLSLKARPRFRVWAVEFKECFETTLGKERLAQTKNHKRFFLKKWPNEFLSSKFEVDAVLLVNVANVVPEESDRRLIVAECTKRLRKGGWFLWMSQYGEPNYKPGVTKRLQAPDGGWFYYLDQKHQTYNKEFTIPEIRDYFSKRYYRELDPVKSPHHYALLFEKVSDR